MSEFWTVDYRARWTTAECDAMVARGELVVGARGYGYSCNPSPQGCVINDEWAVRTIGRKGMGNYGTDILVGRTPRARRLVREAKVRALTAAGVRPDVAEVAARMPHGMELAVARLADDLVEMARRGVCFAPGRAAFEAATGIDTGNMSFPRILAAWDIARAVASR